MATATKNVKTATVKTTTKTSNSTKAAKTSAPKNTKSKVEVQLELSAESVSAAVEASNVDTMGFVSESVEDVMAAFAEVDDAAIAAAAVASQEVSQEVFAATEAEVEVTAPTVNVAAENNEEYFVGTVHELSEKLNVEYVVAHGFARYLTGAGVAQIIGQRKVEGKRGRCASIYRIPRSASILIPV
jgi:hypothetical protein